MLPIGWSDEPRELTKADMAAALRCLDYVYSANPRNDFKDLCVLGTQSGLRITLSDRRGMDVVLKYSRAHRERDATPAISPDSRDIELWAPPPDNLPIFILRLVSPSAIREATLGDAQQRYIEDWERFGAPRATWLLYADALCSAGVRAWGIVKGPLRRLLGTLRGMESSR